VTHFRGLTWDHPRGSVALCAAAERFSRDTGGDTLTWDVHPLEGFESRPIEEITAHYDLVVLDHPHLGDAIAAECLRPLGSLYDDAQLTEWKDAFIGRSLQSYTDPGGRLWALPLDAATQVSARHTSLAESPRTWAEVERFATLHPTALSLAGPHALMTFFSLCVSYGGAAEARPGRPLVSRAIGLRALDTMTRIAALAPADTVDLNPIALLERIDRGGGVVYCPLVYGYVNYSSRENVGSVRFGDAPVDLPGGRHGSVLGGTGLAVSTRSEPTPALLEHLAWLVSPSAQEDFIPERHGQPARVGAWQSERLDWDFNGFYRDTAATLRDAWVRPRYRGYTAFQGEASAILRDAVTGGRDPDSVLEAIEHRNAERLAGLVSTGASVL